MTWTCKECGRGDNEYYFDRRGRFQLTWKKTDELCIECWARPIQQKITQAKREDQPKKSVTISSRTAALVHPEKSLQVRLCLCGCGQAVSGNAKRQFYSGACRVRYHRRIK